ISSPNCATPRCGSTRARSGCVAVSRRSSRLTRDRRPEPPSGRRRRGPGMNDDPGTARTPGPGAAAGPARGAEAQAEHVGRAGPLRPHSKVIAVVVTHRRAELLAESLAVVTAQTRTVDHVIVVDNGDEERVRDLVDSQLVETTYLG